jgi:predicted metalloprotease with PDZ domain
VDAKVRDRLAASIAATALLVAMGTLMFGRFDAGVRLAASDGRVIVTAVNEHSVARSAGIQPGMIVTNLDNVTLVRLPQFVYPLIPPSPNPPRRPTSRSRRTSRTP